jgi:hypothetical protein
VTSSARQRAELVSQIAGLLARMLPGLGEQAALEAAGQGAGNVPGCRALLEHLRRHPDALSSGSSVAPLSLIRLAHALAAAGAEGVVLPGCAGCGKVTADLRSWPGEGLACQSCYRDACRQPCAVCGSLARVAARGPAGPVCNRCYLRDPARHEECARCGSTRRVAWRDADGRPYCTPCYPRPLQQCAVCGQVRKVTAITAAGPVCDRCYVRPPRRCGQCGRIRAIAVRARDGTPDLCASCHRGPSGECSQCGQYRILKGRRDGEPICERCYTQPPDRCGFCGQLAPITVRWETGAVCARCYPRLRASPVPCPGPGTDQPGPGRAGGLRGLRRARGEVPVPPLRPVGRRPSPRRVLPVRAPGAPGRVARRTRPCHEPGPGPRGAARRGEPEKRADLAGP